MGPADAVVKGAANPRRKGGRVPHVLKIGLRTRLYPTEWVYGDRACV